MKYILVFLFVISAFGVKAQAKLGMSHYTLLMPNDTINVGTQVTLQSYVKNKGTLTFNGNIKVYAKIDSLTTTPLDSFQIASLTLLPNDSVLTSVIFTPSVGIGQFKVGGNGNTIVVWPFSYDAPTEDSVRCVLWLNNIAATGIEEYNKGPFVVYPNPASSYFTIKTNTQETLKKITIYNLLGEKIKESSYTESFNINDFPAGCYWLILNSEKKTYKQILIKE